VSRCERHCLACVAKNFAQSADLYTSAQLPFWLKSRLSLEPKRHMCAAATCIIMALHFFLSHPPTPRLARMLVRVLSVRRRSLCARLLSHPPTPRFAGLLVRVPGFHRRLLRARLLFSALHLCTCRRLFLTGVSLSPVHLCCRPSLATRRRVERVRGRRYECHTHC
jgi:hypothetical protein